MGVCMYTFEITAILSVYQGLHQWNTHSTNQQCV